MEDNEATSRRLLQTGLDRATTTPSGKKGLEAGQARAHGHGRHASAASAGGTAGRGHGACGPDAAERSPEPLPGAARHRTGDWVSMPQVEVWGFSKPLSRLGEAAMVAIESGHPQACVLADVYHLYKGGSGLRGLRLLGRGRSARVPSERLPGEPPAPTSPMPSRLPRRRRCTAEGHCCAICEQLGFRGDAVAGVVQPRLLAAGWLQASHAPAWRRAKAVVKASMEA